MSLYLLVLVASLPHRSCSLRSRRSISSLRVRYVQLPAAQLSMPSPMAMPRETPRTVVNRATKPPGCLRLYASRAYSPLADAVNAAPSRCRSSRWSQVPANSAGTNRRGKGWTGRPCRASTRVASDAGGIEFAAWGVSDDGAREATEMNAGRDPWWNFWTYCPSC